MPADRAERRMAKARVVMVDGCLACPFVHQGSEDESPKTWCAHPKWADLSHWMRHGGLRSVRVAKNRHTYPPKWCPLRTNAALVSLSKKGRSNG